MIPSAPFVRDRSTLVTGPVPVRASVVGHGATSDRNVDADLPQLRLACKRAKSLRRPAVLGACFVGRGDLEQRRLIERPPEEFHCDGNLIGFRSIQAAAVW